MKDPWQPYLRLGVVHFMAFPECLAGEGPQLETLAEMLDVFFPPTQARPRWWQQGWRRRPSVAWSCTGHAAA